MINNKYSNKHLKFLEDYLSDNIYSGEVYQVGQNEYFEYYKLNEYLYDNNLCLKEREYYIHTDGKKIYNHKGEEFILK